MVEVPVERIVEKKTIEYVDRFIEREVIREVPVEKIIVQEVPVYVDKIVEKTVIQEVTPNDTTCCTHKVQRWPLLSSSTCFLCHGSLRG